MAARKRTWTPEIVRRRIKASMLINRLQACALGQCEMSNEQIAAAKFLVERLVPRAEGDKNVNVSGTLTLENLIAAAIQPADDRTESVSTTH